MFWFTVNTSAAARWVSLNKTILLEWKWWFRLSASAQSARSLGVHFSRKPKAKRHRHCVVKYFCIHCESYCHGNVLLAYRMLHVFPTPCSPKLLKCGTVCAVLYLKVQKKKKQGYICILGATECRDQIHFAKWQWHKGSACSPKCDDLRVSKLKSGELGLSPWQIFVWQHVFPE